MVAVGWLVACVVFSVLVWVTTTDGWLFSRGDPVFMTVVMCSVVAAVVRLVGPMLHAVWRRGA